MYIDLIAWDDEDDPRRVTSWPLTGLKDRVNLV